MEMKVLVAQSPPPPPRLDLVGDMNSNCSTPYISAPSSPQRPLNFFFYSAPTSPRSSSYLNNNNSFLGEYDDLDYVSLLSHEVLRTAAADAASSSVPFNWELLPGVPRSSIVDIQNSADQQQRRPLEAEYNNDESFEFEFSGQLDMMKRPSLSSADELFQGGKIRPLKPPPRLLHINTINQQISCSSSDSPKSPKSPMMSKFKDALSLSPKHRTKPPLQVDDPFEAALQNTRGNSHVDDPESHHQGRGRGRARQVTPTNSNMNSDTSMRRGSSRKGISRSLSPLRVSEFALLQQQYQQEEEQNSKDRSFFSSSSRVGSKKWRLKDLFLFRSASEGRATTSSSGAKDPLRKYLSISRKNSIDDNNSDSKNSSFRSTSGGSVSKRRGGQGKVSAHEVHYTSKRAVSEEQKKKTSLPYKHGLLGCLGFNPVLKDLSKAFGSFAPS